MAGWYYGRGNIITISDGKGDDKNLIMEYEFLLTEEIKVQVNTYLTQQTRQAQNNQMMAQCLLASLTEKYFN